MFGAGGGGLDPRKMQQMMDQLGIDLTEIDAEEVIIRTANEELVFDNPEVQRMDAQGQQTYQVIGDPNTHPRSESAGSESENDAAAPDASGGEGVDIPDADVEIVAQRTGANEAEARAALEETGGDLAAAVEKLE